MDLAKIFRELYTLIDELNRTNDDLSLKIWSIEDKEVVSMMDGSCSRIKEEINNLNESMEILGNKYDN